METTEMKCYNKLIRFKYIINKSEPVQQFTNPTVILLNTIEHKSK